MDFSDRLKKRPNMARQRGFTLIELVMAMAIIAILTAIALPAYRSNVQRGNRAAAQAEMMNIATREQQYLMANRSYADKSTLIGNGYGLPASISQNYSFDVQPGTGVVPSYTITFTAIGSQTSDGNLTLTDTGVKGPSGKW